MTTYLLLHDPFALSYARLLDRVESFKEAPEHLKKLLPVIAEADSFTQGKEMSPNVFTVQYRSMNGRNAIIHG
jgi:hypothetical protein